MTSEAGNAGVQAAVVLPGSLCWMGSTRSQMSAVLVAPGSRCGWANGRAPRCWPGGAHSSLLRPGFPPDRQDIKPSTDNPSTAPCMEGKASPEHREITATRSAYSGTREWVRISQSAPSKLKAYLTGYCAYSENHRGRSLHLRQLPRKHHMQSSKQSRSFYRDWQRQKRQFPLS